MDGMCWEKKIENKEKRKRMKKNIPLTIIDFLFRNKINILF